MEEDGQYTSNPEHWEFFEKKPVFFHSKYSRKTTGKIYVHRAYMIGIPMDVVKHLNLTKNDVLLIAIKKKDC